MLIHNLSETPSVLNTFISEIRDKTIQKDSMRFRRNIERIGEILGYELSKSLHFKTHKTETPLGMSKFRGENPNFSRPYASNRTIYGGNL